MCSAVPELRGSMCAQLWATLALAAVMESEIYVGEAAAPSIWHCPSGIFPQPQFSPGTHFIPGITCRKILAG